MNFYKKSGVSKKAIFIFLMLTVLIFSSCANNAEDTMNDSGGNAERNSAKNNDNVSSKGSVNEDSNGGANNTTEPDEEDE